MIQIAAVLSQTKATTLTGISQRDPIIPEAVIIHLLTYTALNSQTPLYLNEFIVPYYSSRTLHSQGSGLLEVLLWYLHPVLVWEIYNFSTFKVSLKTLLSGKTYS